jgi:hypothetical protein
MEFVDYDEVIFVEFKYARVAEIHIAVDFAEDLLGREKIIATKCALE